MGLFTSVHKDNTHRKVCFPLGVQQSCHIPVAVLSHSCTHYRKENSFETKQFCLTKIVQEDIERSSRED